MIPSKTIEELIEKHSALEKELSSGESASSFDLICSDHYWSVCFIGANCPANHFIDTTDYYIGIYPTQELGEPYLTFSVNCF